LKRLEASNGMIAADLGARANPAASFEDAVKLGAAHLENEFPGRTVTVRAGDSTLVSPASAKALGVPEHVRKEANFSSLVLGEDNHIYLRAANTMESKGRRITVISSVPLSSELLLHIVQGLGAVTVQPPDRNATPNQPKRVSNQKSGISVQDSGS